MSLPYQYTAGLSSAAAKKQTRLISKSAADFKRTGKVEDRPKVSDAPTPRSRHVVKFEKDNGFPITDRARVAAKFPDTDITKIFAKGIAAYASGSRPNVSVNAWKHARLASVLTNGPALRVDKDLVGPISMAKIRG